MTRIEAIEAARRAAAINGQYDAVLAASDEARANRYEAMTDEEYNNTIVAARSRAARRMATDIISKTR